MKIFLTSIFLFLGPQFSVAETVNTDIVACRDREDIHHLVRTAQSQSSKMFMANALRLAKQKKCSFLLEGEEVRVERTHWMGTVCVVRQDSDECLWVVKNAVTTEN